jgi:AraC-like DNA-binding protein
MDKQTLMRELAHLARLDTREIPFTDKFSFISAFVARRTDTVHSISMPVAGLLVVLEGVKTVTWAGRTFHYGPGQAFCLPEGAYVDVVNEPDPRSGMYRAFHLGFSSELLEMARRSWSRLAATAVARDPTVEMTPALCSALLHTSRALAGDSGTSARVIDHRLLEVLLILAEAGAAPLRPDIRTCSMTDAARAVIRQAPGRPWEVTDVARQLRTTDPTLRRNLRQEGTGFRQILAEERMRAARMLLLEGRATVAEAAQTGGYTSMSHFSKRFQSVYGHLPSELPANQGATDAA